MKKDIKWLKSEVEDLQIYSKPEVHADRNNPYTQYVRGVNEAVSRVKELLDQLDESEKVETLVVPKYVDEWLTRYREVYDLYPALKDLEDNTLGWELTHKWYRTNTHKFVNAYLTGEYEVKEESLYYALVKEHELIDSGKVYWIYDKNNDDVFISILHSSSDNFLAEMSKEDWNKLGINETNADFRMVDEVAE